MFRPGMLTVLRHILIYVVVDSNLHIAIKMPLCNVNIIHVLWVNNLLT